MTTCVTLKGTLRRWGMIGLLVLTGCGGQADVRMTQRPEMVARSDATVVVTQMAPPLVTAIPIPLATARPTQTSPIPSNPAQGATLAGIDLAPILAQADDLPAGFTFSSPNSPAPGLDMQFKTEGAVAALEQGFTNRGAPVATAMVGHATIWVYDLPTNLHDLYAYVTTFMGTTEQTMGMLGERSSLALHEDTMTLFFVRCQAVVYLDATALKTLDSSLVMAWAQKIDQRIQESPLCAQHPIRGPSGQDQGPRRNVEREVPLVREYGGAF